jgi:hypothetical protein
MPINVNGFIVSDEMLREEATRLAHEYPWKSAPQSTQKAIELFSAAEKSVVNHVLLSQYVASYPIPLDPALVEREVAGQKTQNGCREAYDERGMRAAVELQLRLQWAIRELAGDAAKATDADAARFFEENKQDFTGDDLIEAAHIVVHVNESRSEADALARIQDALRDLENGMRFSDAARMYSDCEGDGDLGVFRKGEMVPEFEFAVLAVRPGERTGIFRTPFGFHIAELRTIGNPASAFRCSADVIKQFIDFERSRTAYEAAADILRGRSRIVYQESETAAGS